MTPVRRTTRHLSHMTFTDARTFIVGHYLTSLRPLPRRIAAMDAVAYRDRRYRFSR